MEAREQGQAVALGYGLLVAGTHACLLRGEHSYIESLAEELATLATTKGLGPYQVWATMLQGWLQSRRGKAEQGIARMRRAMAEWQASGTMTGGFLQMLLMADAYLHVGQVERGLGIISDGLIYIDQSDMRFCEAEMHRLQGALLESMGRQAGGQDGKESGGHQAQVCYRQAEQCYRRAIAVARSQGARLWELRAAIALARLQASQDLGGEGREALAEVCGRFTEGFDLPDLREARTILGG